MWTYRCQFVRCGKAGCGTCPHGPYWYGFRKEGGRTRSWYFGRADPRPASSPDPHAQDDRDAILNPRTASLALACEILGITRSGELGEAKSAFSRLCILYHPDRGGDSHEMLLVNAAWSYWRSCTGR